MAIYYKKSASGDVLTVSTQNKQGNSPQSLYFYSLDNKPINESSHLYAVITAGRKLSEYISNNPEERSDAIFGKANLYSIILKPTSYDNLETMQMHPQFFKIVELHGASNIYHYVTTTLKLPVVFYNEYFILPTEDENDSHYIKFNNAKVFFPTNMRESRKQECLKFLSNIYKLLSKHNLQKLFDVEIRFVNIGKKNIGQYEKLSKSIKIEPNVKDSYQTEYTILHELGHKYWYEIMSSSERDVVKNKFRDLVNSGKRLSDLLKLNKNSEPSDMPNFKNGDIIIYHGNQRKFKNKRYEVSILDDGHIRAREINGNTVLSGPRSSFYQFNIKGNDQIQKIESDEKRDSLSWFPTNYSGTDAEEWFAESFAFYILNKIKNEEVYNFWKSIIK